MQEMPGQILLGQLTENSTEPEIREVLKQAFLAVERGYFQTVVDPLLVERDSMREASEGEHAPDYYSASYKQRLETLNKGITSSTAALVVLIFNEKVFVANSGDCRAQVCVVDPHHGVREVIQLSVTHDLKNEDEVQRLRSLNLDLDSLQGKLGNQETTRCIGNYLVKGGYKENSNLASATSEPVIAEPEITSFLIKDSTNFLVLISSGLYKALEEVTDHVNPLLVQMIMEEFSSQTTLNGVAQAVVDRVARMHQEHPRVCRREDMTLLVRNFKYPWSLSRSSPLTDRYMRYPSSSSPFTPTFTSPHGDGDTFGDPDSGSFGTETDSSDSIPQTKPKNPEKIKAYVNFSNYYRALETNPEFNDDLFSLSDL